jgi:hypothetical protein
LMDVDTRSVVERRFHTATESCLHIGNHLIARGWSTTIVM